MITKQKKLIKPKTIVVIKIDVSSIAPASVDEYMDKTISKLQIKDKFDTSDILTFYIPVRKQETDIAVYSI